MRVETHIKLVARNRKIAQYLFFFSFGLLVLGLLVVNQPVAAENSQGVTLYFLLSALMLPLAFVSTMVSVRMTNLWVREPRPEVGIRDNLKGINTKSVLYNYYHFPARHVLIAPQGVFAIVTRFQERKYRVEGDHWRTLSNFITRLFSLIRFDRIGNPTRDAQLAADHVKSLLADIAPDVPVYPLIIFSDARAHVTAVDSPVPVLSLGNKQLPTLKEHLRSLQRGGPAVMPLTPEQIRAFEAKTLPA